MDIAQRHYKKHLKIEIEDFVNHELSTRKIVIWARDNLDKNQISSLFEKAIVDNDVIMVLDLAKQKWTKLRPHYRKMRVAKVIQNVMDVVGLIEESMI